MRSMIVVPLVTHDLRLGALTLIWTQEGHKSSAAEAALAEELGRRCALAAENSRLYRDVIRERDIAARANRAKEEFLAVLSHEMRNPLMPVVGWTRVLGSHLSIRNDPMLIEGVRAIERNARTLNRLVEDCLDLARIAEGKIHLERSVVDLNEILLATAESARERAESGQINLAAHICSTPLWVSGDTVRIEQVVVNLMVNAVKYTPRGGDVSLHSSLQDGEAEIAVSDTGIGIEAAVLDQIFQPFHQGAEFSLTSGSGLGLGLAICRQIVQLHEGRIWAESNGPGTGSVFRVRLPLAPAPEARGPSGSLAQTGGRGAAIRVLLVEDAADVLFLLRVELEQLGFSVLEARDGESALRIAAQERPGVIVSDIKMPVVDGYEMIRRLRATPELSGIPAIALTGFGRKADIEKALRAGFNACLTKPAEAAELAECIRNVARRGTPTDSAQKAGA
jgi:signal transduction histidine kinase/ActR/RegA family two-component response regulator